MCDRPWDELVLDPLSVVLAVNVSDRWRVGIKCLHWLRLLGGDRCWLFFLLADDEHLVGLIRVLSLHEAGEVLVGLDGVHLLSIFQFD